MSIKSNATGSIFLIGAFQIPTEADRLEGKKKEVVLQPTFIVADDESAAHTAAVLKIPRELDPDRVEVLIALPFGR